MENGFDDEGANVSKNFQILNGVINKDNRMLFYRSKAFIRSQ